MERSVVVARLISVVREAEFAEIRDARLDSANEARAISATMAPDHVALRLMLFSVAMAREAWWDEGKRLRELARTQGHTYTQ